MPEQNEFLYFAYGSNMSARRLATRTPSARMQTIGSLSGHRLTFDKVSRDTSGKCDCEYTGNDEDRVFGVLYTIAYADRPALDKAEGLGNGYDACEVTVETQAGRILACSYRATDKDAALKPFEWYKHHVLAGAREAGLPDDYVATLDMVEAIVDPNPAQTEKEMLVYRQVPAT
ncbi:gamma-glutamylcyclotransferase family protein [Burkholderia sp. 22PA0099]|uniref:gamma-glutamylcyclotransferase family protein n=1 Tax=Burkholderia sp. 22PA0099 TaxID=3237372 RepID=UPI0039C0A2EE